MPRMRYIVVEGIDGSGKTTQVAALCERLPHRGITPIRLLEPTYGRYGRQIREHVRRGDAISVERQRELFTADRREHVANKITPLLDFVHTRDGFMIVQDRGYLSAPAYQSEIDSEVSALLKEQQAVAPQPDSFVLLDVSPELAVSRLKQRGSHATPFESLETLEAIRQRYMLIVESGAERVHVVDGTPNIERVTEAILGCILAD